MLLRTKVASKLEASCTKTSVSSERSYSGPSLNREHPQRFCADQPTCPALPLTPPSKPEAPREPMVAYLSLYISSQNAYPTPLPSPVPVCNVSCCEYSYLVNGAWHGYQKSLDVHQSRQGSLSCGVRRRLCTQHACRSLIGSVHQIARIGVIAAAALDLQVRDPLLLFLCPPQPTGVAERLRSAGSPPPFRGVKRAC